jgi:hypothetical protein
MHACMPPCPSRAPLCTTEGTLTVLRGQCLAPSAVPPDLVVVALDAGGPQLT